MVDVEKVSILGFELEISVRQTNMTEFRNNVKLKEPELFKS
jgi:hypothetical protein